MNRKLQTYKEWVFNIFTSKGDANKNFKICSFFANRNVDNIELIHC